MPEKFKVGDKVFKTKGYTFEGVIIMMGPNTSGEMRFGVELINKIPQIIGGTARGNGDGMIHIFSENQLEKA